MNLSPRTRDMLRQVNLRRVRLLRKLGPFPVRYFQAMDKLGVNRRVGFKLMEGYLLSPIVIFRDPKNSRVMWVQRNCRNRKKADIEAGKFL